MTLRACAETVAAALSSLVLVAPLVYLVVAVGLDAALAAVGVPDGVARPLVFLVGFALAIYTTSEAVALQLHGTAALWRGTRRDVLVRHAVLSLLTVVGLVEAGGFAVAAFTWSYRAGFGASGDPPFVAAIAALLAFAAAGGLLVFGFGVLEGFRRAGRRTQ